MAGYKFFDHKTNEPVRNELQVVHQGTEVIEKLM